MFVMGAEIHIRHRHSGDALVAVTQGIGIVGSNETGPIGEFCWESRGCVSNCNNL